jgi:hypothetical protein
MKFLLIATLMALFSLAFSANKKNYQAEFVPGEIIVKLKSSNKSFFQDLEDQGITLKRPINLSYGTLYVLDIGNNKSIKSVLKSLKNNPNVIYSEPNFIWKIERPVDSLDIKKISELEEQNGAPNDPLFNTLWGLSNTGSNEPEPPLTGGVAGADIRALEAWNITKGDKKIKVGVLDTGIDYNHPDLKEQIWTNLSELNGKKGIDDDKNGYVDDIHGYDIFNKDGDPMDGNGHGSHCAGVIGAIHDNGIGVAGVMGEVSLVPVKFLSDQGAGSSEQAILGLDYAVKIGVDITSNSWGGAEFSQALKDAILNASNNGIVFVAAAGNDSRDNDQAPHYPSSYEIPNVISVGGLTAQNELADWSNYGAGTVLIAAPGKNINSTVLKNSYKVHSGTSMATPHVAGVIGLLLSKEGRIPHSDLKERLMSTSDEVSKLRGKIKRESGRINAYNLLSDIRPIKKFPKESEWVDMKVETFESEHPYKENLTETRIFTVPGSKYLRLKIKKWELESSYDYLGINSDKDEMQKLSGQGTNGFSEYVDGETLKIVFKSDTSVNKWGFLIEEIQVIK